jgi:molybdopterin-biosynthesis enzyme MoeA-like protein
VFLDLSGTRIVSLPGVPAEMKAIFEKEIAPALRNDFVNAEEWLRVKGVSESRLSPALAKIFRRYKPLLYIKSHPRGFENGLSVIHVQVILTTRAKEKRAGLDALREASRSIELAARKLGATVSRISI